MLLAYEIALTRRFGTTADADVLALTFIIAFALANEVAGWIGVLLIPHYLRIGAREGWGAVGGVLSAVFLATMLATGGVAICTIAVAPGLAFLAIGRAGAAGLLRLFSPHLLTAGGCGSGQRAPSEGAVRSGGAAPSDVVRCGIHCRLVCVGCRGARCDTSRDDGRADSVHICAMGRNTSFHASNDGCRLEPGPEPHAGLGTACGHVGRELSPGTR